MKINRPLSSASVILAFVLLAGAYSYAEDVPPAAATPAAEVAAPKHTFEGTKQCKLCHNKADEGQQYDTWKKMRHARAYTVLLGDRAKAIAVEQGLEVPPHESPSCLKCHVTGYDVKTKKFSVKAQKTEGVQCESCHGPASDHLADGKSILMKKDTTINVLDNIIRPTVKTCIQCHNDENPTWDPEKYTLEDGTKAGFDFKQAAKIVAHKNPKKEKP